MFYVTEQIWIFPPVFEDVQHGRILLRRAEKYRLCIHAMEGTLLVFYQTLRLTGLMYSTVLVKFNGVYVSVRTKKTVHLLCLLKES